MTQEAVFASSSFKVRALQYPVELGAKILGTEIDVPCCGRFRLNHNTPHVLTAYELSPGCFCSAVELITCNLHAFGCLAQQYTPNVTKESFRHWPKDKSMG
jgi:hypothetical protein